MGMEAAVAAVVAAAVAEEEQAELEAEVVSAVGASISTRAIVCSGQVVQLEGAEWWVRF